MLYREYGKTGIKVSTLGFGGFRFPRAGDRIDMDLTINIMRRAFDLGVNYVDTAAVYGSGLSRVGRWRDSGRPRRMDLSAICASRATTNHRT
jgi:aryl-alcohol dehydrogenase-like predicted oxidoreductase